MGHYSLPAPGTDLGPCVDDCDHTDCEGTRNMSAIPCSSCGDPIEYDVRFYFVGKENESDSLCHARCYVA